MICKNCPHFRIVQKPIKGWDFGMARCNKHNLVVDFANMRKLNKLECVDEPPKEET